MLSRAKHVCLSFLKSKIRRGVFCAPDGLFGGEGMGGVRPPVAIRKEAFLQRSGWKGERGSLAYIL